MKPADELMQEIEALRARLSRLSRASLLINESLDSARSLTGASYGLLTLLDDAGPADDFLSSGMALSSIRPVSRLATRRRPPRDSHGMVTINALAYGRAHENFVPDALIV